MTESNKNAPRNIQDKWAGVLLRGGIAAIGLPVIRQTASRKGLTVRRTMIAVVGYIQSIAVRLQICEHKHKRFQLVIVRADERTLHANALVIGKHSSLEKSTFSCLSFLE